MADAHHETSLEDQIEQWRTVLRRQATGPAVDVSQLEPPLRAEIAGLTRAGLTADEAFLIAVKRLGRVDAGSRVFAHERSARVWQQLGVVNAEADAFARTHGLDSVMDRCVKIEHARLFGGLNWAGVNTRVISARRAV